MGTMRLQSIPFTVSAGGRLDLNITGSFLFVEQASHSDFLVSMDYDTAVPFDRGIIYNTPVGDPFKSLTIIDGSGGGLTGVLKFGLGDYKDTRVTLSGQISTVVGDVLSPGDDVTLAAGAATLVAAANADRREILVTNLDNTETLRLGDSTVTATRGLPVPPGATATLDTAAAVYAWNPGAATVDVALVEITV